MKSTLWTHRLWLALPVVGVLGTFACDESNSSKRAPEDLQVEGPDPRLALDHPSAPLEFAASSFSIPVDPQSFAAIAGSIFGAAAKAGQGHHDYPVIDGVLLDVRPDPRTETQVRITLALAADAATGMARTPIVEVPASFESGEIFIDAGVQALTISAAQHERGEVPRDWQVGYRTRSALGGELGLFVESVAGESRLRITFESPSSSLLLGRVNSPSHVGDPFEVLSARAPVSYGVNQIRKLILSVDGSDQADTFCDGTGNPAIMAPQSWYHFCVSMIDGLWQVKIGINMRDGRRIQMIDAPATLAHAQHWVRMIDRISAHALANATPTTSTALGAFDYWDRNDRGGARLTGWVERGSVKFYHEFETAPRTLLDTAYVAAPDPWADPLPVTACDTVDSVEADLGQFRLSFALSRDVFPTSDSAPLSGIIYGGIYRAADMALSGPIEGATSVEDFAIDAARVMSAPGDATFESTNLVAGDYKITAFLDTDRDADPSDPFPEGGEPVAFPFEVTVLRCARQPELVEFSLAFPE